MSQSRCLGWHLRFETLKYINTMMLHSLVLRVGKHKMGKVREIERIQKIRKLERIEGMKGIEGAIAKIK